MADIVFDAEDTLSGKLSRMSREEIVSLGISLCAEADKSFGPDKAHGCIWPGNVTWKDGEARLGPTGLLDLNAPDADIVEFCAPETYWNEISSPASDVYSIGLILYTALNNGEMPFYDGNEATPATRAEAMRKRVRGSEPPDPVMASGPLAGMIKKAIDFRQENRYPTPAEFGQALREFAGEELPETELAPEGRDKAAAGAAAGAAGAAAGAAAVSLGKSGKTGKKNKSGKKASETAKTEGADRDKAAPEKIKEAEKAGEAPSGGETPKAREEAAGQAEDEFTTVFTPVAVPGKEASASGENKPVKAVPGQQVKTKKDSPLGKSQSGGQNKAASSQQNKKKTAPKWAIPAAVAVVALVGLGVLQQTIRSRTTEPGPAEVSPAVESVSLEESPALSPEPSLTPSPSVKPSASPRPSASPKPSESPEASPVEPAESEAGALPSARPVQGGTVSAPPVAAVTQNPAPAVTQPPAVTQNPAPAATQAPAVTQNPAPAATQAPTATQNPNPTSVLPPTESPDDEPVSMPGPGIYVPSSGETPDASPTAVIVPTAAPAASPSPSQGAATIIVPTAVPAASPSPSQGSVMIIVPSAAPTASPGPSQGTTTIIVPSASSTPTSGTTGINPSQPVMPESYSQSQRIQQIRSWYSQAVGSVSENDIEFSDDASAIGYFAGGELVKIKAGDSSQPESVSYFFKGGKLYFALVVNNTNAGETRLYYWNSDLVRWIGPDGEVHDSDNAKYSRYYSEGLEYYRQMKDLR